MCGRYLLHAPLHLIERTFGIEFSETRLNLGTRFNIAPTQAVAIVRLGQDGRRELAMVRWGLIPSWAKEASIGARMINARAEGIAAKSAFRTAFRARRCLVPASGFYEWAKLKGGRKQPMLIQRRDHEPFAFAGLWERWTGPDGSLDTCTIITTDANALLAPIHNRMPVILEPGDHEAWLEAGRPGGEELLRPCPVEWLEVAPVSTRVNSVRNDDAGLLEPQGEPVEQQPSLI